MTHVGETLRVEAPVAHPEVWSGLQLKVLSVHALDMPDPAALAAGIKRRYETPLKEIFGC